MRYYTRILLWENNRRLVKLAEFRDLVIQYFNDSNVPEFMGERVEQPKAEEARVKINRMMNEVHDIILYSGVKPSLHYTPPAVVGGYTQNIDLVQNIFQLHRFRINPNSLLDFIDRSIGIYENNIQSAFLRAINPFFYLGVAFDLVARIPFIILGRAGFNRQKAEESWIGRAVKGTIYIVTVLSSLLTVLQSFDYLEPVKKAVIKVFGVN